MVSGKHDAMVKWKITVQETELFLTLSWSTAEPQNNTMAEVGGELWRLSCPIPCSGRVT